MPHQLFAHDAYVELRLNGVVDAPEELSESEWSVVGSVNRVLVDYSDVEQMNVDPYTLAGRARKNEERGIKVAVFAPRPALFGLNRQVLQLAGAGEGRTARVFRDRDEAVAWLVA
jgi:hypothetical protein